MYGLEFVTGRGIGYVLRTIFPCIIMDQCSWAIDCLWLEGPEASDYDKLQRKLFSTQELYNAFKNLDDGFMYFGRIRRYSDNSSIDEVITFQDFVESKCSMIILCVDANEYEIYSKNDKDIREIHDTIIRMEDFSRVKLCEKKQIGRTKLIV